MSYNIWLLRFDHGNPTPMDHAAFQRLTDPYVVKREPEHDFLELLMPDGGGADVHAVVEPDGTLASVMLTHFSPGAVLDLVAKPAKALRAAVILQDGVAIVADVEQRDSLVLDLRQDAVIVELDGLAIQGVVDPERSGPRASTTKSET